MQKSTRKNWRLTHVRQVNYCTETAWANEREVEEKNKKYHSQNLLTQRTSKACYSPAMIWPHTISENMIFSFYTLHRCYVVFDPIILDFWIQTHVTFKYFCCVSVLCFSLALSLGGLTTNLLHLIELQASGIVNSSSFYFSFIFRSEIRRLCVCMSMSVMFFSLWFTLSRILFVKIARLILYMCDL